MVKLETKCHTLKLGKYVVNIRKTLHKLYNILLYESAMKTPVIMHARHKTRHPFRQRYR